MFCPFRRDEVLEGDDDSCCRQLCGIWVEEAEKCGFVLLGQWAYEHSQKYYHERLDNLGWGNIETPEGTVE